MGLSILDDHDELSSSSQHFETLIGEEAHHKPKIQQLTQICSKRIPVFLQRVVAPQNLGEDVVYENEAIAATAFLQRQRFRQE